MSTRKMIREVEALGAGWKVTPTGGSHLKCTHPEAAYPVFISATPSCPFAMRKVAASFKRALRAKQEIKR